MKKFRNISLGITMILAGASLNAQIPTLDFITGYTNDARLILGEYMAPFANMMGANLNAGWYNTAKPHKLGGFDITTTVSVVFAPITDLEYDLNTLSGLQLNVEGNSTMAPTIVGDMEALPVLVSTEVITNPLTNVPENVEIARLSHPNGIGVNFLPLPMAQVSLGLIKGTEISVRYVPNVSIGEYGSIGLFGIGGKHSISQWIPVIKKLKFINIAVQGGYTKLSTEAVMNIIPDVDVEIANPPAWDDQRIYLNSSAWTLNLIASQSIPIITVYEGIGFSSSKADFAMLGSYPLNTPVMELGADFGKKTYTVIKDPIEELLFENNNNLRLNAGVRLKLGFITLHYDFTRTLYSTHTAGIGITFR
ncbi:DUF6588 family protein [Bacteroidota bacterium]